VAVTYRNAETVCTHNYLHMQLFCVFLKFFITMEGERKVKD